jgi:hypothetical protein
MDTTTVLARRVLEGEVLDPEGVAAMIRVVALRSPFSLEREEHRFAEGITLEEILADLDLHRACTARVFVGDVLVPERWWPFVRPKRGHVVTVRAVPLGGGGGTKSILGIVLGIALIAVGLYTGLPTIGIGVGLVVGGLAGLIFKPKANLSALGAVTGFGKESPALAITGAHNTSAPYSPIPRVYGAFNIFPPVDGVVVTFADGTTELLELAEDLELAPDKEVPA